MFRWLNQDNKKSILNHHKGVLSIGKMCGKHVRGYLEEDDPPPPYWIEGNSLTITQLIDLMDKEPSNTLGF